VARYRRTNVEDEMQTLSNDHLLMEFGAIAELENGTLQEIDVPITVGMVRELADPNPCRCGGCQKTFPLAAKLLRLQEDLLAKRITSKQLKRELRRMGYVRREKIRHH
jgi:hypothetical protein